MGAGALVGSSAAEERGLGGALSDTGIRAKINLLWFDFDPSISEEVELSVREGRVLLTGYLSSPQLQIDAVRLAWQVPGVREVRDETKVGDGTGVRGYAADTWITMQLRSDMLFDGDVESINYSVKTVDGVVYLMGIGQNRDELEKVVNHARGINGVKKVVSYVRLKEELVAAEQAELFSGSDNTDHAKDANSERPEDKAAITPQPIAVEPL